MKALLLKDIYVLYKQLRYLLFVLLMFCAMPGPFASAFAVIYSIMLPVTTIGFDEQSKWRKLAAMMPYTSQQLVFSKYVLGYLGTAAAFGFSALLQLVSSSFLSSASSGSTALTLIVFPCIGLLLLSVNLPLVFRFGPEKGRLVYIIACGLVGASAAILPQDAIASLDLRPVAAVLVLATPLIQWFSYKLSLKYFSMEKA